MFCARTTAPGPAPSCSSWPFRCMGSSGASGSRKVIVSCFPLHSLLLPAVAAVGFGLEGSGFAAAGFTRHSPGQSLPLQRRLASPRNSRRPATRGFASRSGHGRSAPHRRRTGRPAGQAVCRSSRARRPNRSWWTGTSVGRRPVGTHTTGDWGLCVSMRRNANHPVSAMDRERCRLRIMPRRERSSTTMTDLIFARFVVALCRKSVR